MEKSIRKRRGTTKTYDFQYHIFSRVAWHDKPSITQTMFGLSKESSGKSTLHQDHRGNYSVDSNSGYRSVSTRKREQWTKPRKFLWNSQICCQTWCNHRRPYQRRPQEWKIYQSCDTEWDNCNICINGEEEIAEINKSCNYFSKQAKEANDFRRTKQLSLVIRFFDETSSAIESFISFPPMLELDAASISKCILNSLETLGLDYKSSLIGLGFDGASVMRGQLSGV